MTSLLEYIVHVYVCVFVEKPCMYWLSHLKKSASLNAGQSDCEIGNEEKF